VQECILWVLRDRWRSLRSLGRLRTRGAGSRIALR
jgi:hypothetical protein